MRETPSMDAQVVANLPNGSRILILGDEGDWWYVFAFNRFGYVSKQYVSVS
ncbi:MAG: SH3 domain-containing protein [Firmicutes bacterium]|nr:SH3 domain-containing protein [Bacillota bacterium]